VNLNVFKRTTKLPKNIKRLSISPKLHKSKITRVHLA